MAASSAKKTRELDCSGFPAVAVVQHTLRASFPAPHDKVIAESQKSPENELYHHCQSPHSAVKYPALQPQDSFSFAAALSWKCSDYVLDFERMQEIHKRHLSSDT